MFYQLPHLSCVDLSLGEVCELVLKPTIYMEQEIFAEHRRDTRPNANARSLSVDHAVKLDDSSLQIEPEEL